MIPGLLPLSPAALRARMDAGHPVRAADLPSGWYRGVSLGLPAWVDRLAWKTFAKTVHREGDAVRGWNVRLEQDGIGAEPRPRLRRGRPRVFGHYAVVDDGGGVVLDYGRGRGPRLDPGRLMRDPVVALRAGEPTLLLGRTWLALGPLRLPTPSFFVLEYAGPTPDPILDAVGLRG